jgi:hypothetical protein
VRFPSKKRAFSLRLAALGAAALLLSGCMAEMVEKQKPRKGPVPEVGFIDVGGGEIRYSAEGWGFIVSLRRSTALRRINHFCRKELEPRISDEFTHDDVDTPYAGMDADDDIPKGLEHYHVAPFHHIVFECVAKKGVTTVDEVARAKAAADEAKAKAAAAAAAAAADEIAGAKTVKEPPPQPKEPAPAPREQAPAPMLQAPAPTLTPPPGEPPK